MKNQPYADDIDQYALKGNFSLERAQNAEFLKYWVAYGNVNEDFSQSFLDRCADLQGVPFCFWILHQQRRVGALIILPNNIGDFFLMPPFVDAFGALSAIMPLLHHWSDSDRDIRAQGITSKYLQAFQKLGFRLTESRHWMIRPTAGLPVSWSPPLKVATPLPSDAPDIAKLLYRSFKGGVGQYGDKDEGEHLTSVNGYFSGYSESSPTGQASLLVVDSGKDRCVAVSLVNMHKGLPAVQFAAVDPEYQRQGLATNLMHHALSSLESEFQWLKIAVTVGNLAQAVYEKLGFRAGEDVHNLVIPA